MPTSPGSILHRLRPRWAVARGLLLLALPIIAAMVSRTVMSFVDFIMVSQLGTEAQAAIMPAGVVLFTLICFGMGTLSIIGAMVSQSLGRGELDECSAYAWQGLYLSLIGGVLVLPAWLVAEPFFAWVGHEERVQQMEVAYVQIGLLSVGPAMAGVALSSFFNGVHRPWVGFWSAVICNLFNVLANYALIFGNFGFPAMGIAGAAWATVLASALQMLMLLGWMLRGRYQAMFHSRRTWRFSWRRCRRILRFGSPAGAQFIVELLAWTVFTLWLIGRFGTEQLAAHNIAFRFLELSFMPAIGLGTALTAAVGRSIGEGDYALARSQVRWALAMAMGYMGLIALSYVLLGTQMASLLSDNEQVILWASRILLLCAVFQVFDAMGITFIHALRGAGDSLVPALVMIGLTVVVCLGGGVAFILLLPHWGSLGPWTAATVYVTLVGLCMGARYRHGAWQRIELLEPARGGTSRSA